MKIFNNADHIIERIDRELLLLYDASKNKAPYRFFDFYSAFQAFNESALREGERQDYFKLKKDRYNIVFLKLMTGVYKTKYIKTIRYNTDTREQRIRVRFKLPHQNWIKYYKTVTIEDEWEHERLDHTINVLNQSDAHKFELTLYEYILEDRKVIYPPDQKVQYEGAPVNVQLFFFYNYFQEVTPGEDDDDFLSFKSYVKDLQFRRELVPEIEGDPEETDPGHDTGIEITAGDQTTLTLESLFESTFRYQYVMKILVECGYCQPGTYIWADLKKGYKNHIANILKYLHFQNYYKSKVIITNKQIQEVALNTFHIEISMDTIKHADITKSFLNFIPPASAIEEE
jgi:hypothetical protein